MLFGKADETEEAPLMSGVSRAISHLNVFHLIKVERHEERRSCSSLPNVLSLMKAFVSEQEEEL